RPFVTLHHFTNPLWFEDRGGFASAESVGLFERFAQHVLDALGGLCVDWTTFNEPNVYAALGYFLGEFSPEQKGRFLRAARVTPTLARAHAAAYRLIHSRQPNPNVGWAQHFVVFKPRRPKSAVDRWLSAFVDRRFNDNFAESVLTGQAPFPLNHFGDHMPEVKVTFDYLGFTYSRTFTQGLDFITHR